MIKQSTKPARSNAAHVSIPLAGTALAFFAMMTVGVIGAVTAAMTMMM